MPHMDTKIDIIYDNINSFPISPARQEDIKEKIRDFGLEEWNRGYDKCLYNQACCDTDEISKRADLQDQIDDLQQQVGELEFLIADMQKRSADILDVIGWERYKKKSGDTQPPVKSRFYVEFDRAENDPGIGPRTYRDFMVVFATDKWAAENKVRIAYPYPYEKNFETFLLSKQEA
jgi:hypothetical protein